MIRGAAPEVELVCLSVAPTLDESRRDRIADLLARDLDWSLVRAVARHHGVLPLVRRGLAGEFEGAVDESFRDDLDAAHRTQTVRNLSMTRTLHDLLDRFDDAGIDAIPFKGPVLAATAHGSLADRTFNDLDVLVRRDDFRDALDLLETTGYEGGPGAPRLDDAAILGGPFTPAIATEYSFQHPDDGVTVEVRWRLGSDPFSFVPGFDSLWERRTSVAVAGRAVPALDPVDRLLYLSYHGGKHAFGLLKWVSDVAEAAHALSADEWAAVTDRAATLGATRRLRVALGVASRLLGVAPPTTDLDDDATATTLVDQVADRFRSDPLCDLDTIDTVSFHVAASETRRTRLWSSLALLPIHPTLEDYRAAPVPGPLHPALYLVRAVRLALG